MIDYYVSAKRESYGAITHLKVHRNNSGNLGLPGEAWTKSEVIDFIDNKNKVFYTVYRDALGKWQQGDNIHTVAGRYLRTDGNNIQKDNLDNLPQF